MPVWLQSEIPQTQEKQNTQVHLKCCSSINPREKALGAQNAGVQRLGFHKMLGTSVPPAVFEDQEILKYLHLNI